MVPPRAAAAVAGPDAAMRCVCGSTPPGRRSSRSRRAAARPGRREPRSSRDRAAHPDRGDLAAADQEVGPHGPLAVTTVPPVTAEMFTGRAWRPQSRSRPGGWIAAPGRWPALMTMRGTGAARRFRSRLPRPAAPRTRPQLETDTSASLPVPMRRGWRPCRRRRRGRCRRPDHVLEFHAHVQQLGERRRLVEDRPVHVVRVQVAGDRVGREPLLDRAPRDMVGEAAHAVAHVEEHAAFRAAMASGSTRCPGQDAALVAVEAVRHDVAAAEPGQQPVQRRAACRSHGTMSGRPSWSAASRASRSAGWGRSRPSDSRAGP